jgi:GH15 family glucan-1,4-alpha-glucosidase
MFYPHVDQARLTNTALDGTYRIDKRIVADSLRPTVVQEIEFTPLKGVIEDYHVHALLAPHLVNVGMGNTAWIVDYKGVKMLFASGATGRWQWFVSRVPSISYLRITNAKISSFGSTPSPGPVGTTYVPSPDAMSPFV